MDGKAIDGEWVTLTQAAALLRVSVDTLRRRLKRGQLDAVLQETRYGKTWFIWLEGVTRAKERLADVPEAAPEVEADGEAVVELIKLVARLREENRNLAHRVGNLEGQLQQAKEAMRLMAASQAWQDRPSEDRTAS